MWDGILAGSAVSACLGILGLGALHWAYDKGNQLFMLAFMGGMVGRLVLAVAISALVLSFTSVHRTGYIVSMLVVYLLFLGCEIFYALSKNAAKSDADIRAG